MKVNVHKQMGDGDVHIIRFEVMGRVCERMCMSAGLKDGMGYVTMYMKGAGCWGRIHEGRHVLYAFVFESLHENPP